MYSIAENVHLCSIANLILDLNVDFINFVWQFFFQNLVFKKSRLIPDFTTSLTLTPKLICFWGLKIKKNRNTSLRNQLTF